MNACSLYELKPGMVVGRTICDSQGLILIARGIVLTESYIKRLRNFKIQSLMIEVEANPSPPPVYSPAVKHTLSTLAALFQALSEDKMINIQANTAKLEQIMYAILERPAIQSLLESILQSEPLFCHSLRSTLLALNMGLSRGYDFLNLEYLGMCALIHDCGMGHAFQEENIQHTHLGFEKLRTNMDIDMIISLVCLQHHECFDGSGPFGFRRMQIAEFARLITVADHYDRLMMKNNSPRQAIIKIAGSRGSLFDPQMVQLFEATIK